MLWYNTNVPQNGPLVKRLRHRPLTAKTWVRFPYGSPTRKDEHFGVRLFLLPTRAASGAASETQSPSLAKYAPSHGFERAQTSASSLLVSGVALSADAAKRRSDSRILCPAFVTRTGIERAATMRKNVLFFAFLNFEIDICLKMGYNKEKMVMRIPFVE